MTTGPFPPQPGTMIKGSTPTDAADLAIILDRLNTIHARIEGYNNDLRELGNRAYGESVEVENTNKQSEPPVAPGAVALNSARLDAIMHELDIMSSLVGRITNLA